MRNDFYPAGTVKALLHSGFVTPQTKAVLEERLQKKERAAPPFFDEENFAVLEAVCDCLLPQNEWTPKIPLAMLLEEELATGKGKGWRYHNMPPMKTAMVQGLKGIEEETQQVYKKSFVQLAVPGQEKILAAVQKGKTVTDAWEHLPSPLFFTELLAMVTELYYCHPLAKEEIGDVSFADAKGWDHIGLNETDGREPVINSSDAGN